MRILVVDDDDLSRESVEQFLSEQMNYDIITASNGEDAFHLFEKEPTPVVITDMKMSGLSGIDLLKQIKELSPQTEVIIMTGFGDMKSSIEALRYGATDYLLKPVNIEELALTLERIENYHKLQNENTTLKNTIQYKEIENKQKNEQIRAMRSTLQQINQIGTFGIFSPAMQHIVSLCYNYHEERDVPVLIQGETGTGKEVIAHLIHKGKSDDCDAPFVPVNCAAIAPHLFESELFGYAEGAFTGAKKNGSIGKFELAQGGTIFLDEIGELPMEFQPKLLRALQEREIYRVGGEKLIKLDVRFIFATNRDLKLMIEDNLFRGDLYFRINLGQISIPPLCQRKEDIVPLAQMFLEKYAKKRNKAFMFIADEARDILTSYNWPGNVRELQNTIERVVLLYNNQVLNADHIAYLLNDNGQIDTLTPVNCLKNGNVNLPDDFLYLEDLEKEIVSKALKKFDNNKTRVADYLGISRSALRSRLNKL